MGRTKRAKRPMQATKGRSRCKPLNYSSCSEASNPPQTCKSSSPRAKFWLFKSQTLDGYMRATKMVMVAVMMAAVVVIVVAVMMIVVIFLVLVLLALVAEVMTVAVVAASVVLVVNVTPSLPPRSGGFH
eukprot:1152848-Pleurochrysis_carterae.AAC.1